MKKIFALAGLMTAAVISLTNCQPKELGTDSVPVQKFTISASTLVDTKTSNDGMSTLWDEGDSVNVFYYKSGSYTSLGGASIADGDGTSQATFEVSGTAPTGAVDWYVFYPYEKHMTKPTGEDGYKYIGDTRGINQDGFDNMAALCGTACPMYGVAKGKTASEVNVPMKQLASVIEFNITNSTGAALVVNSVTLNATEDIIGTYYYDFASDPVVYTPSRESSVFSKATVNMEDSELAAGESGKVYLPIKPYTHDTSKTFDVTVSCTVGSNIGSVEFNLRPNAAQSVFSAGKIKPVALNITSVNLAGNTIAEALAADGTYTIKGAVVTMVYTKGFFMKDNTGTICVYQDATPSVEKGDIVTVVGSTAVRGASYFMRQFSKTGLSVTKTGSGGSTPAAVSWKASNVTAAFNPSSGNNTAYMKITAKANTNKEFAVDGTDVVLYASGQASGVSITAGKTYELVGYAYDWTTYGSGESAKKEVIVYIESAEASSSGPTTVEFDFNEGLDAMGLSAPDAGDPGLPVDSFSQDGVTVQAYNGSNNTPVRIFLGTGDNAKTTLRTYNGSALVIKAPAGKNITKISSTSNVTSTLGEDGACAVVTLYYTGSATINKLTVTLEESTVVPGIGGAVALVGPDASSNNTLTILCGGYNSAPSTTITKDGTVVTAASLSNKTKDSMTLTYSVSKNSTSTAREGWVKITSGSYVAEIKVTQQGLNFSVSRSEVYLNAKAGSSATLTVRSDVDWTAQYSSSSFSVSPESFEYDGETVSQQVTVSAVDDNTTTSDKTLGTFTIKRTDNATLSVSVIQKSCKLDAPDINLTPNGSAKTITATWNAVPNASGYKYKISSQSEYTETTETTVTFTGLTVGTTYTVYVIALGDNDPYVDSDEASAEIKLSSTSTSETIDFSEMGYENGQAIETVTGTNFTITFDKGSNSNAPKYYTSGTAIRCYGSNTFTVSATKAFSKIEITFGSSDGSNPITADNGSYDKGTWTGSSKSTVFTIGGTSGNRRIKAIKVTF